MSLFLSSKEILPFGCCVQCGRCSSGRPMAFESPHTLRKVLRFLQIGRVGAAVRSPFLWFCATCQARPVPCPRGVDMAGIMLALRRKGRQEEAKELSYYRAEKFSKQAFLQAGKAGQDPKKC